MKLTSKHGNNVIALCTSDHTYVTEVTFDKFASARLFKFASKPVIVTKDYVPTGSEIRPGSRISLSAVDIHYSKGTVYLVPASGKMSRCYVHGDMAVYNTKTNSYELGAITEAIDFNLFMPKPPVREIERLFNTAGDHYVLDGEYELLFFKDTAIVECGEFVMKNSTSKIEYIGKPRVTWASSFRVDASLKALVMSHKFYSGTGEPSDNCINIDSVAEAANAILMAIESGHTVPSIPSVGTGRESLQSAYESRVTFTLPLDGTKPVNQKGEPYDPDYYLFDITDPSFESFICDPFHPYTYAPYAAPFGVNLDTVYTEFQAMIQQQLEKQLKGLSAFIDNLYSAIYCSIDKATFDIDLDDLNVKLGNVTIHNRKDMFKHTLSTMIHDKGFAQFGDKTITDIYQDCDANQRYLHLQPAMAKFIERITGTDVTYGFDLNALELSDVYVDQYMPKIIKLTLADLIKEVVSANKIQCDVKSFTKSEDGSHLYDVDPDRYAALKNSSYLAELADYYLAYDSTKKFDKDGNEVYDDAAKVKLDSQVSTYCDKLMKSFHSKIADVIVPFLIGAVAQQYLKLWMASYDLSGLSNPWLTIEQKYGKGLAKWHDVYSGPTFGRYPGLTGVAYPMGNLIAPKLSRSQLFSVNYVKVKRLGLNSYADSIVPYITFDISVSGDLTGPGYGEQSRYNKLAILESYTDAALKKFVTGSKSLVWSNKPLVEDSFKLSDDALKRFRPSSQVYRNKLIVERAALQKEYDEKYKFLTEPVRDSHCSDEDWAKIKQEYEEKAARGKSIKDDIADHDNKIASYPSAIIDLPQERDFPSDIKSVYGALYNTVGSAYSEWNLGPMSSSEHTDNFLFSYKYDPSLSWMGGGIIVSSADYTGDSIGNIMFYKIEREIRASTSITAVQNVILQDGSKYECVPVITLKDLEGCLKGPVSDLETFNKITHHYEDLYFNNGELQKWLCDVLSALIKRSDLVQVPFCDLGPVMIDLSIMNAVGLHSQSLDFSAFARKIQMCNEDIKRITGAEDSEVKRFIDILNDNEIRSTIYNHVSFPTTKVTGSTSMTYTDLLTLRGIL